MNMINRILKATSTPRHMAILAIVTIVNFAMIGGLSVQINRVSGGETLLDFSVGHTQESITTTLTNYGAVGIDLYRWVQRIDLIHPLIYSLLFASIFFLIFRQTRVDYLVLLPFTMGTFDYLENVFLNMMVNEFPIINSVVVQIASILSYIKNGIQYLTIAILLFGLLRLFLRRNR